MSVPGLSPLCAYMGPVEFSYWHPKRQLANQAMTASEFQSKRQALVEYLKARVGQSNWSEARAAIEDLIALEAEWLRLSQRDLGKYAPIIEQLRERQSRC